MIEKIIGLIAPHMCLECGDEGTLLCAWCTPDAILRVPDRCYRCLAISQDSHVCLKCRKKTALEHVWVSSVYADVARQLVYGFKFERAKAAANTIAGLMDGTLPYLPQDTVVTYVPTAHKRIRLRGYDQTKLIAKRLAKLRGLPCQPLLIRHGHVRQVGATKVTRAEQAARSYTAKGQIQYASVLLIDDILTTGATVEAASKILKKAGAKHVSAAVFAQKQ